jgi:hypothetical protein
MNDKRRSIDKSVSERQTVSEALPAGKELTCSPNPNTYQTYGPHLAVASLHPRFHGESRRCHHHLQVGGELGQINKMRCSVKDNVRKHWIVLVALSSYMQATSKWDQSH